MTGSKPETVGDLVGITISGGIAHFPGRAGERVRHFADLDPTLVAELLTAAEAVTSSPARFEWDCACPP
ncbi:hypothetical protein [Sphingomonas sp. DC1100-1]|uniref:hypothetical protein n=1 Tax=unclassified Sphingomonas TaxID=196159 RepID=UPI003CE7D9DC